MRNIGILGGSFNPIHKGHLHIGEEALKHLKLDEVIFIPAGTPPHKRNDKSLIDEGLRYDMVKIAIEDYDKFSISDYEVKKHGICYTYETLEHFRKIYKNDRLYFITGADCLIDIYSWKNISEIFKNAVFVVFSRPGFSKDEILKRKEEIEREFDTSIIFLDIAPLSISSTDIRKEIKGELNGVEHLIPSKVLSYIDAHGLYR